MEENSARWSKSVSTSDIITLKMLIHLDWVVIICLRELRLPSDSLDLPDGADHLTVGDAVDRVEGLVE